ncbi:broad-specificity NMP kinase [Lipingzhangella halophila]|uniref:Broad-specificity NMP kinase n=1 Tax=Lipingzhangella halophila TaxID=1783352 RepID=A0A7W7W4C9_9ACTN|nr:broad-specificity NMP kinase [Lipingzhangella halophila]
MESPPAVLVCQACEHRQPFRRLPLWCVTGPSGTGKSTVSRILVERLQERFVVLEQDVLWLPGLRDPAGNHRAFRSAWLRMAAMIHQSGRPVVLCGTVAPPELEPLDERVLFCDIRYLALVCEPNVLAERLRGRPAWRAWSEERIEETLDFNAWLRDTATELTPPVKLLDTTHEPATATAERVQAWLDQPAEAPPPEEPATAPEAAAGGDALEPCDTP